MTLCSLQTSAAVMDIKKAAKNGEMVRLWFCRLVARSIEGG